MSVTRFLDSLAAVDWSEVRDAYGDGGALPGLLREVAQGRDGDAALAEILGRVAHGGDLEPSAWVVVAPLVALLADGASHTSATSIAGALLDLRAAAIDDEHDLGFGPGEEGFRGAELAQVEAYAAGRVEFAEAAARIRRAIERCSDGLAVLLTAREPSARALAGALLGRARALSTETASALATACSRERDPVVRSGLAIALGLRGSPKARAEICIPMLASGPGGDPSAIGAAIGLAASGDDWSESMRAALEAGLRQPRLDAAALPWAAGVLADVAAEAIARFDPRWQPLGQVSLLDALAAWIADPEPRTGRITWPIQQRIGQHLVLRGLARWRATMMPVPIPELDPEERALLRALAELGAPHLPALCHCGVLIPIPHSGRALDPASRGPLDEPLVGDYFEVEQHWPVWQWLYVGRQFDLGVRRTWPARVGDALARTWSASSLVALAEDIAHDGYGLAVFASEGRGPPRSRDAVQAVAHAVSSVVITSSDVVRRRVDGLADMPPGPRTRNLVEMLARPWRAHLRAIGGTVPEILETLCREETDGDSH